MRLIRIEAHGDLSLIEFTSDFPPYAILSHTWGSDHEEVNFRDFTEGTGIDRAGYGKIQFCRKRCEEDGLSHFWIDTCCIDKSSSAELSEAINSMFRWYQSAFKCYVYLSDVSTPCVKTSAPHSTTAWESSFRESRWFRRGWTLQELIAPSAVEFFSQEGSYLGDKRSLEQQIHEITGIPIEALRGAPLADFEVDQRFSWMNLRETKRPEDMAYSLCGIFGIYMPLFYGEGRDEAISRLRRKIGKSSLAVIQASKNSSPHSGRTKFSAIDHRTPHRDSCMRSCSCRCHRTFSIRSPQLLSSAVGDLYLRCAANKSRCNEATCKQRAKNTTTVTYRFPGWLTSSAIHFTLVSNALSTQSNLTSLRVVPSLAAIFDAVATGDVASVQRLFQEGKASIFDVDERNWTLLHSAFAWQKGELCRFLLSQGADASVEADNGSHVIGRAWYHAQSNSKGPSENMVRDSDVLAYVDMDEYVQAQQYTVVHKIILGLSTIPLSRYLEATSEGINEPDARGHTALWWACVKGDEASVRELLDHGADPNIAGGMRQTPLHVARTAQVAQLLIDCKGDPNALDILGRTPLHCYCYRKSNASSSLIEAVAKGGVSINAKSAAGQTALHYAIQFGNTHLIPTLLALGIPVDATKNSGETALAVAVRHNKVDALRILLENSADLSIQNNQAQSLFHIGACYGQAETLELLATSKATGAGPGAKDLKGMSAFDYFGARRDRSLELISAFDKFTFSSAEAPNDLGRYPINICLDDDSASFDSLRHMTNALGM